MKKLFFALALIFIGQNLLAQKNAYVIYNAKGRKVSYDKMLRTAQRADILLFGELHNNAISHWLQYEVTNDLSENRDLILGAEMFEADNQTELNDYLAGTINYKVFDSTARLWPNAKTDYMPLVNLAKDKKINFIASNIPRRFARIVHKDDFIGLDTLSDKEKTWIAPLPIPYDSELPTYKKIIEMMGEHGSPKLVKAQAIKDATMAYFISKNMMDNKLFVHYNGAFHSDYFEGIGWYLQQYAADKKVVTFSTVEQADNSQLEDEHIGKADFIICVDSDMTKTY